MFKTISNLIKSVADAAEAMEIASQSNLERIKLEHAQLQRDMVTMTLEELEKKYPTRFRAMK